MSQKCNATDNAILWHHSGLIQLQAVSQNDPAADEEKSINLPY